MKETIRLSRKIRKLSLELVYKAKASHIGGALSMADVLAVLYEHVLRIYPSAPEHPERDRFLLSKGHACSALYATLALKHFFDVKEVFTYGENGSDFISHASHKIPGVEWSTGSLGHALPVGCGMALAAKRKAKEWKTYCLISDGELDEGSNWEAILFAPQHQLDNLILMVDYNKIQSLGDVKEVIDLYPIVEKFTSFNWETFDVDGHDHNALIKTFKNSTQKNGKPKAIILHTIKGKGVSFMENQLAWHYKSPNEVQLIQAIDEINRL